MNFRNKYLLGTLRILFGLMMLFSGIIGFVMGDSTEGVPPEMIPAMTAFWDSGIFQMIKVTEIVVGLMLVLNFLPALAAILIAPVSVGIVVFTAMLAPSTVFMGIIICLVNAYFGYAYWGTYKHLFKRK